MIFVNRQDCIDQFHAMLMPSSSTRMVVFYGISGIGKSSLLHHLREIMDPSHPSLLLDFDLVSERTSYNQVLTEFVDAFRYRQLPQTAWDQYAQRCQAIVEEQQPQIAAYQIAAAGSNIINSPQVFNVAIQERQLESEHRAAIAQAEALLELARNLTTLLVVFIDHWETLLEQGGVEFRTWLQEQVLRDGCNKLPNLRVIVASDRPWETVSGFAGVVNHEVLPFTKDDACHLMAAEELSNPDLQATIYERTNGNPQLIHLAIELCKADPTIDLSDLVEELTVDAARIWLAQRIVDRLGDKRSQIAIKTGVILRNWTLDALEAVCQTPELRFDLDWYHRFTTYPFIQDVTKRAGWKTFIAAVREIQIDELWRERNQLFHDSHRRALAWFGQADNAEVR